MMPNQQPMRRSWRMHAILGGVLLIQMFVWAAVHQDTTELLIAFTDGSTQERLDALHVLANRGEAHSSDLNQRKVLKFLQDPDSRIRDVAFSNEVCKIESPALQAKAIKRTSQQSLQGQQAAAEWWRAFIIHTRKVGSVNVGASERLMLEELGWYLDTLAGRDLPLRQIRQHLSRVQK